MITTLLLLTMSQVAAGPAVTPAAPAAAEPAKPRLVVLDPELRGAAVIDGAAVASAVAASVRELDAFEVTTTNDIRTMISFERQRQLLAVNAETTNITDALGARHVLAMWVAKLGTDFQAEVRLVDSKSGAVVSQKQSARLPTIAQVATSMTGLTQEVLAPLLREQQGKVLVRVSEEAAEIRIDDVIVGSSPLKDALTVSRGRHRLEVRKDGFIAQLKPINVAITGTNVEEVRLVPSPDFVGSYQARNSRMRLAAWITTGAAAALIVSGLVVDRFVTDAYYRDQFAPRALIIAGGNTDGLSGKALTVANDCRLDPTTCYTQATAARAQVQTFQAVSLSLIGAGVVSGIFATYFWLSGEDPNRYAKLAFVPTNSGFGFALSGGF